jgi:hypothetical protein
MAMCGLPRVKLVKQSFNAEVEHIGGIAALGFAAL